ncbi:hypothetical protein ACM26V_13705 [Salipaludibacillus sp. HK11]|uniref:hypothetical protein n=1 Tax=Salipaludibacillus sp. HK11 TaxID=3394320 RepID=UPI0039FDA708
MFMTVAISQWDAFMIETLVSKGTSREELLEYVIKEDINTLANIDQSFDYNDLIQSVKKNETVYKIAMLEGYTIKFLTKLGVKKILSLKFNLEEGRDYQLAENNFESLILTNKQLRQLRTLLSTNWTVIENDKVSIVPSHL